MPAKKKDDGSRAVRTSTALAELKTWLASFDAITRERGQTYFENGHVLAAWASADHYFEADVQGQEVYTVTLFLTRGKWSSRCSCPMEIDCKHVAAAGLAWIARNGADFDIEDEWREEPAPPPEIAFPTPPPPFPPDPTPLVFPIAPATKKVSFRDEWSPKLAEKLGRPLTDSEGWQLGQLAALFMRFQQAHFTLHAEMLREFGFADAIPADAQPWVPLFRGWWTHATAPANPWALWQYLAYSIEQRGCPIPEVFRPRTDTARVHTALDTLLAQQQLQTWRAALAPEHERNTFGAARVPLASVGALRVRIGAGGGLYLEARATPDKPWKPAPLPWVRAVGDSLPSEWATLPPAEGALTCVLALKFRYGFVGGSLKYALAPDLAAAILDHQATHGAIVLPDGRPFAIEPEPLVPEAIASPSLRNRLEIRLVAPDGTPVTGAVQLAAVPVPLYLHAGRVWRGPPKLPGALLPIDALADPPIMSRLRAAGVRLPAGLAERVRRVVLRPVLRCWLVQREGASTNDTFHLQLLARADDPPCEQTWLGLGGWEWTPKRTPPARSDNLIYEFEGCAAEPIVASLDGLRLGWYEWMKAWGRVAAKNFPEDFAAWHATLPTGVTVELSPELAGLLDPPVRLRVDFSALPAAEAGHDWFDLTVALRVEDTTLTSEEIELLLKARGKWVRLSGRGWRRLELTASGVADATTATLDRLGLSTDDVLASGKAAVHRVHALQLASEATSLEATDAKLAAALRDRAASLAAIAPPALPLGLTATLRPYQVEGFHFLAHLAAHGFGGVLADDMGLGKTVQTLAWLLHLSAGGEKFRALVVCPKSVTHGWLAETQRFAPDLRAEAFTPARTTARLSALKSLFLVANYTQLRLHADWFRSAAWDVVVLDEGQFIKNPTSQAAAAARALPARHRLVLTGTPVENRLTDLWSLFAFAQPGLLGTQTTFKRQYAADDPAALARLRRRTRHFLLRRTKAQAAPDLPPRTEDDLVVELEPAQRKLYDAELKRARAQLLGIETTRALDKVRFNILASLLRLRQICCHPALIDAAHAELPSAKLDALVERLEELKEEGHQVLVFSQFVEMLALIRTRLVAAEIGHLMLTGETENRGELVETFQRDKTKTVFLLSLKAAGFGLNLTAASYAILYDPWWNPAVEAQAIDRTHRIGQTKPVIAYRLLAEETVEQKIRALQKEKAALAAAVVQEETLASVLDLESLRKILA